MVASTAIPGTRADADLADALCLMGPTASGKTALAMALADRLPVELVSVDASQVYRGLDIGTAKPTREEQARYPHRLIDIRDPAQAYSAAEFRQDALREMEAIVRAGRVPLLVGGTMFYFRALMFGLTDLPSADPAVRARLAREAEEIGWRAMHGRLQALDPETAARIHPNDPQRIQRALEIIDITGQTPSERKRERAKPETPFRFTSIALVPQSREELHRRIERRYHQMLKAGLIEEVEGLRRRPDLHLNLPSVRTVGYRQAWEYLTGTINYTEMVERALTATRQFAKRQMTWLRSYPEVRFFTMRDVDVVDECLAFLKKVEPLRQKLWL
jgi:tRNA dimethylallyltransferase